VDAEDELFGIKLRRLEMLGNSIDRRNPEDALAKLPGAAAVDAKGLCDKPQTTVYTFRGKEERTDVDAMALKE
jgi:outer membrane receptor for Fe3+-dicitrate